MYQPTLSHFHDLFWFIQGNQSFLCPNEPGEYLYAVSYQNPEEWNVCTVYLPVHANGYENCFRIFPKISDAWKAFCKKADLNPDKIWVDMHSLTKIPYSDEYHVNTVYKKSSW